MITRATLLFLHAAHSYILFRYLAIVNHAPLASAVLRLSVKSLYCEMQKIRKCRQFGTGAERLVTGLTLGHTLGYQATQAWLKKTLAIVKLYLIINYETKEALRDHELFSRVVSALRKLIHNVLWVNIESIKICWKTRKSHMIIISWTFILFLFSFLLSFFCLLLLMLESQMVKLTKHSCVSLHLSPLILSRQKIMV